jgi:serine/threonine-protein kinase
MPLSVGSRLGPYEICALIGAGGMGEVYRARDPRMGREVAIKVSAKRFSDRFDREVRAVAALNHPNICQVYDVGPNYLVMELVEGPTLADRIQQGGIPLEEALAIARQIRDALEAAHEKGIIHRDLKPSNIKIKPDGAVKVLDFGLAKIAEQPAAASGNPEESPTVAMGGTIVGQIMGTAAYMAPEQARGKVVDKRADIWAFGVVLYEMLTARRLFEGETTSDTLAGVLTKEPDWVPVPPKAQRLLKSCLEKDPKRRLRDIADAWRLLEDAPAPAAKSSAPWKVVAGVLALICAILLWAPWRGAVRPVEQVSMRLDLDLGPDVSFGSTTGPAVILSPDGTRLVFASQGADGVHRLFTRRLDQPKAVQMPGTEGAFAQFFSPDGQWVGFFAQGKLKKTRVDGGEPISLCDAPASRGGSWGEDGNIIAALDQQAGLSQIPPQGGGAVAVTELNLGAGETTHRWPQVLPGGKAVLFFTTNVYGHYDDANLAVVSLKDRRTKILLKHAGMYPRYLPSGHLVYITKGALFALPFDPERLEVRGAPTLLWELANNPNLGFGHLDFSRNGTLAYRTGRTEGLRSMQWLDGAGKTVSLGFEPAYYIMPRLSPDGRRVAYTVSEGSNQNLWMYDFERGTKTRLTNGQNAYPVWTPDGRFVVFQGLGGMFWTRADGSGKPQPLTRTTAVQLPFSFSPNGTRLAYGELTPGAGGEIRTVLVETSAGQLHASNPELAIKVTPGLTFPTFSPDGRWLAYADTEGGPYEVYVRAFPDNGTQVQISNAGGVIPLWSRNGHELFYRTEDQRIMVANYTVKGNSFVAGKPRMWFAKQLANTGLGVNFDLAPDGKRFLVIVPAESTEPRESQSHVILLTNFFDEVRRRVAGR